jgi:HEAT repeat protein
VPTVDHLLARLAVAASAPERCALLEQLQPSEDTQATYAITAVLDRARLGSVRACATQALALQPTAEAQSFLVDLAEDPEPAVHQSALDALATRDEAARAVVIEATHSEDLERRVGAVEALLKAKRAEGYVAAALVLPLIEDPETLGSLIDALGESHDPQALPALQALMDSADRVSHLRAITALGELGVPSASARLEGFLEVGSSEELNAAVEALKRLSPERLAAKLQTLLHAGSSERQELALSTLLTLDVPNLSSVMREQLVSGDAQRVGVVLVRLIGKPEPSLEAELAAIAQGDDAGLRWSAMRALAALATPSARATAQRLAGSLPDALADQLLDPNDESLEEARARRITALTRAEHVQPNTLAQLARDASPAAQEALLRYLEGHELDAGTWASVVSSASASTVQRFVDRGASAGPGAKHGVIEGLRRRGDPSFVATLRADLRGDPATRKDALLALAELGDDSVAPELRELASSSDADDRSFAVQMLSSRTDGDALRELERLASDPDAQVMSGAVHALQTRSPELVNRIVQRALRASSPEQRATVLSTLSDLNSGLSRPLLELGLRDPDDSVATQAVQLLSTVQGPASARQLLALVNDSNRSDAVRAQAALGLRGLGGPLARANRALLDSLSEPDAPGEFVCNPN